MQAGFYIHIPFCRQACRYCDFHFSVSLKYKPDLIKALKNEMELKANKFSEEEFSTLYFGGGTPSVLSIDEIMELIDHASNLFRFSRDPEISLEANPDDLDRNYLRELKAAGVKRLSIGIQSFRDKDLELMRRSHNSEQAEKCIKAAQDIGFEDINGDLIYGIPGLSEEDWCDNLEKLMELNVQHISAYLLTFEPGTVFDHWRKKNKIEVPDDDLSFRQYKKLIFETGKNDFIHYEVSNFCKAGFESKHNINYWKNGKYVGIGPSAHSYDQKERFWNISSTKQYIEKLLKKEGDYFEKETLKENDKYNEYILTSLRTMWGIDLDEIMERFGNNYVKYTLETIKNKLDKKIISNRGDVYFLDEEKFFLADQIIREFFIV